MKYYMGIDPGLDGAIALYRPADQASAIPGDDPTRNTLVYLKVFDLPTLHIKKNKKLRRVVDLDALRLLLDLYAPDVIEALIEEPHAMPSQGVTSMFGFGFTCGVIQMGVASAGIKRRLIDPAVWKAQMRLGKDKDEARQRASRMFPAFAHLWSKKGQDGRAEAALLAALLSKLLTL